MLILMMMEDIGDRGGNGYTVKKVKNRLIGASCLAFITIRYATAYPY